MRRLILVFVTGAAAVIILGAIGLYTPHIAGPFFAELGGNQHFGTTGNEAIGFGTAQTLLLLGGPAAIAAAVALAVHFFRRRAGPRRRF